jgi:hypothetical protein
LGYSFDISLLLREEALTGVIAAADTAVKGGGEDGDLRTDCKLSSSSIEESPSSSKPFSRNVVPQYWFDQSSKG